MLVVEDDESFAHDVVAVPFEDAWRITFAYNIPQALGALEAIAHLDLALVDLNLPGGRHFSAHGSGGGFDVVDRVQRRYPDCHVVVLTGYLDGRLINAVARRGAQYMVKAGVHEALGDLANMQITPQSAALITASGFAAEVARAHGLTTREQEVLELSLTGLDRDAVAEELGTASNTVKHHFRVILRKSGARRMEELRNDLRCAADVWRAQGH